MRRFAKMYLRLIFLCLALLPVELPAQHGKLIPNPLRDIPRWVRDTYASQHLDDKYTIIYERFPTYLKGDFNGDGRKDVVLQIQEAGGGRDGIAIFHGRKPQALSTHIVIFGAGKSSERVPADFKDLTLWASVRKGKIHSQAVHPPIDNIKGDLIQFQTGKGKYFFLYWNGRQYVWSSAARKTE